MSVLALRLLQRVFGRFRRARDPKILIRPSATHELRVSNRVGLAAGFDKNAEIFSVLGHLGFGFVEVGTVTPEPQIGNPRPRLWRVGGDSLVNHMGFNNVGLRIFRDNIVKVRRYAPEVAVLANVGKNRSTSDDQAVEDYRKLMSSLGDVVDGFVINVSSPNTPGLQKLQSISFLESVVSVVPPSKPVLVKFSSDLDNSDLLKLCDFVGRSPLAGVVVVNTSQKLAKDRYHFSSGGLSGPPLLERCVESVTLARSMIKPPKCVIGVGGISSPADARRIFAAGADLIEIYTAFVYQGLPLLKALTRIAEATN